MTEPVVRPIPQVPDLPHPLGRAGVHHDPRSRAFAFAPPAWLELRDVAWRRRVPVYDQGRIGSCTAHALCGALSTLPDRHRFRSERKILGVYSEATRIDPWPGGYYAPEWSDTGSDGLSVAKVALAHGWISEYRHAFGFDAVLQSLMLGAGITGTVWRREMFETEPDGRVHPLGDDVGGHEYEAYGVDVENKRVWFFNSWGGSWGVKGRFYMAFDDYEGLLAAEGDYTILIP